jgi:hypothetical protein
MDDPRSTRPDHRSANTPTGDESSLVAAWLQAKRAPNYREEAARQAASAAHADVEDRVMEWIEGVAAEAWDDL